MSHTVGVREAARIRFMNNRRSLTLRLSLRENPMAGKGIAINVFLSDKVTLFASYPSIYQATKGLKADNRTISKYINSDKLNSIAVEKNIPNIYI
jgi:hypothetical protein